MTIPLGHISTWIRKNFQKATYNTGVFADYNKVKKKKCTGIAYSPVWT